MGGLNKIGISLTIIFVVSLVLLLAELFYVFWRRRVFHRHAPRQVTMQGSASVDSTSQAFSETSSTCIPFSSYSKELVYFYFCMNSSGISRVQPNSAPPSLSSGGSCPDDEMVEVIDVFKLQNMYGPPRFLFTIKEEEKENDAAEYQSDKEKRGNTDEEDSKRSVKLEECFNAAGDEELSAITVLKVEEEEEGGVPEGNDHHVITMDSESDNSTPPFSTPTGSPAYFTPSASPNHTHSSTEQM